MVAVERLQGNQRMSAIVIEGDNVHLSGITSMKSGIQEQTQDVLQTLEQRLAAAGSDKDHMVRATIYLRDIAQFAAMNEVWDAWVNPATAPARACVEARLGREAALVEIVVDAVKA